MNYHCYKITCKKTGKSYVGFTSQDVDARWRSHQRSARRGSPLVFHKAIRKYGAKSFTVEKVASFRSREEALKIEVKLISDFQTMSPAGYNMTCGGEGCIVLSDEAKEARRTSVKNAHADPNVKVKHRLGIIASMTPDVRRKISQSKVGMTMHPNAKAGILAAKKTEEYRKTASEAASKTWAKSGYKAKWTAAKLDKHIATAMKFPRRDDGLIFSSTRAAANYMRENGWPKAAPNNIAMACSGKYKSSCGCPWSWIDGDEARAIGGIIT